MIIMAFLLDQLYLKINRIHLIGTFNNNNSLGLLKVKQVNKLRKRKINKLIKREILRKMECFKA